MLALGNELHSFLILGLSSEIASKVTTDILQDQYDSLLPEQFRLIPYDTLYKIFESKVPPKFYILTPGLPIVSPTEHILSMEAQLPSTLTVDYSQNGLVYWSHFETLRVLRGVLSHQTISGERFIIKNVGYCPYCGDMNGFESLSGFQDTGMGKLHKFFYGRIEGYLYRLLRCTEMRAYNGMPLEFMEIYNAREVMNWFDELTKGRCGRCGSSKINFNEGGFPPFDLRKKWQCEDCGFYDELHEWGSLRSGA